MQLGTQAQWGWHAMPNPGGYRFEDALTSYETAHGSVVYPDKHELGPRNPTATPYPGEWLYWIGSHMFQQDTLDAHPVILKLLHHFATEHVIGDGGE